MLATGEFEGQLGVETYKSSFSHKDEVVKPGYQKVVLDNIDKNVLCVEI